jgi:hypothetical protein
MVKGEAAIKTALEAEGIEFIDLKTGIMLADNLVRLWKCVLTSRKPQVAFLRAPDPSTGRQGRTLREFLILT